jgi:dolichol-phosphate mannosyltransferase
MRVESPELPVRRKLGVATPLANEEGCIHEFLDRVLAHLLPNDRIYCVLDTVCKDRTKDIVQERSGSDTRIKLVWAPENRCVVDTYVRGYREALADGAEWILEMDGGLSHLPEELPQFVRGMEAGYDYVGGSRYLGGVRHRSPWTRVLISWGGTWLTNLLLQTRMTDMTSGYECFTREALQYVPDRGILSRANFFQTEIRFMMHRFRWLEVPIHYTNAQYSLGRSSLREAFANLWQLYRNKAHYFPKTAEIRKTA